MFFVYGTSGRTFSGTLESFMPLSGVVQARSARKSGNRLLDAPKNWMKPPAKLKPRALSTAGLPKLHKPTTKCIAGRISERRYAMPTRS